MLVCECETETVDHVLYYCSTLVLQRLLYYDQKSITSEIVKMATLTRRLGDLPCLHYITSIIGKTFSKK